MDIQPKSLIEAMTTGLSPSHAQLAGLVLDDRLNGLAMTEAEAGAVVVAALAEIAPTTALAALEAMRLAGVSVVIDREEAWLEPEVAMANNALSDWLRPTIGEVVGAIMVQGASVARLDVTAPIINAVYAVETAAVLETVAVEMTYPATGGLVVLSYGAPLRRAHCRTIRELSGSRIVGMGVALREADAPVRPVATVAPVGALH